MPRPISGYQSPDRSLRGAPPDIAMQRRAWAQGLSNEVVRALAAEYLMGHHGDDCVDAWQEFKRRFPEEVNAEGTGYAKNAWLGRSHKRARRRK